MSTCHLRTNVYNPLSDDLGLSPLAVKIALGSVLTENELKQGKPEDVFITSDISL